MTKINSRHRWGEGIRLVNGHDNFGEYRIVMKNGVFIGEIFLKEKYHTSNSHVTSPFNPNVFHIKDLQGGIDTLVWMYNDKDVL